MEDRSPHSLPSFRTSLRTEVRPRSESGYFASITRTGPTNRYPFPTTRLKKPRSVGVVTQRGAKLSHNIVDVFFGVDKQIGAPQLLDDVVPGHHLLATLDQKDQQLHGLLLELDSPPGPPQFVASQVDFYFADALF